MFEPLTAQEGARITLLADIFIRIGDERMKDIGLYNHSLKVETVGFRRWEDSQGENWLAGILITPWFMNFMLLPTRPEQLSEADVTLKRRLEMPCGEVLFTQGGVEEIGPYLASSLYSPMERFDVQAIAANTAWAAVDKYFKAPEMQEPGGCPSVT